MVLVPSAVIELSDSESTVSGCVTAIDTLPVRTPAVAVMVVAPTPAAVTTPVAASTVAMPGAELLNVGVASATTRPSTS